MSPAADTAQVLVDLGHYRPGAEQVVVVGGGETVDGLAAQGAGDVDREMIAVDRGPLHRGQLRELSAEPVDLSGDLLLIDCGAGDLHAQTRRSPTPGWPAARQPRRRSTPAPTSEPSVISISGSVNDVDVVLDHGARVVVGQGSPQRLHPSCLRPQLGLQQAARGAVPGRKPGILTSRAMRLKAASTSVSNSASSNSMVSLTRWSVSVSTLLRTAASVPVQVPRHYGSTLPPGRPR